MNAVERRQAIAALLAEADAPLSATAIASKFSVSRQIIVGDIALLRAAGTAVIATPRGYLLERPGPSDYVETVIACRHDDDRLAEEMYAVVDAGGALIDVTVEHSVYGQICAPLRASSRYDVDDFLHKLRTSNARPLCDLTGGIHLHRLRCPDAQVLDRVLRVLEEMGLLLKK